MVNFIVNSKCLQKIKKLFLFHQENSAPPCGYGLQLLLRVLPRDTSKYSSLKYKLQIFQIFEDYQQNHNLNVLLHSRPYLSLSSFYEVIKQIKKYTGSNLNFCYQNTFFPKLEVLNVTRKGKKKQTELLP